MQEGIARLAAAVPTHDTQVYGEVYIHVGTSSAPVFDPRTSNPHLWEGTLSCTLERDRRAGARATRESGEEVTPSTLSRV